MSSFKNMSSRLRRIARPTLLVAWTVFNVVIIAIWIMLAWNNRTKFPKAFGWKGDLYVVGLSQYVVGHGYGFGEAAARVHFGDLYGAEVQVIGDDPGGPVADRLLLGIALDTDDVEFSNDRSGFELSYKSRPWKEFVGTDHEEIHKERRLAIGVPYWLVVLTSTVGLGLVAGVRPIWRWRRRRHNQCVKCGYSLAGNESGVCPECGKAIEAEP